MPLQPWMFCLWVSQPGHWSSWGVVPPEVTPPWILCLLISSGSTLLVIEIWVPLGSTPLGKMPLGALSAGTTPLGTFLPQFMVSGRAHSHAWPVLVCLKSPCLSFPPLLHPVSASPAPCQAGRAVPCCKVLVWCSRLWGHGHGVPAMARTTGTCWPSLAAGVQPCACGQGTDFGASAHLPAHPTKNLSGWDKKTNVLISLKGKKTPTV